MALVRNRQALFMLLLIVLDIAYFLEALKLPRPFQLGEPGPAFMPMLLALVLLVAALRILWTELAGSAAKEEPGDVRVTPRALALIGATGLFIWMFEALGYWIATPIYVFAVAWLFEQERVGPGWRAIAFAILISAGVTATGWLFFVTLFDLFLPTGPF